MFPLVLVGSSHPYHRMSLELDDLAGGTLLEGNGITRSTVLSHKAGYHDSSNLRSS